MTVFTGPVFTSRDPIFPCVPSVPITKRFWRVAATTGPDGEILAMAFVVSQQDLIRPIVEEIAPAAMAKTFQVRVRKVEELTGLDCGDLRDHDPTIALEAFETTEQGEIELASHDLIVLS